MKTTKFISYLITVTVIAVGLYTASSSVFAHGAMMDDVSEINSPLQMMRYVEDQAVGDDVHEEMEELMVKMMSGNLSETEADRLVAFMNEYPGPMGMMTVRLGSPQVNRMTLDDTGDFHWGIMNGWGWGAGFWVLLVTICVIVWSIVGLLAIVWLWRKIQKQA